MCPRPTAKLQCSATGASADEVCEGVPSADAPDVKMDVFRGCASTASDADLQDFIWVMNDEPHASRRKEMIKRYPELKELMGHEPKTKYVVLALMALQLGLAYAFREEALWGGSLRFWLTAYFVGATATQALFLACHEISHNLAFRKFSHNKLFGIFANIPMLFPFFMYFKYYHNEHHKYQGVDGVDTDIPTEFEAKLLSNFFGKLIFLSCQVWFYAVRPIFVKKPVITAWHALNYAVQIAFIGSTVYFLGWGPIFYLFASAHLAGSLHPIAAHFIAEHYVFKGKDAETFSYYGPLNSLTFNVGYHNEHHDFPTVPWTKLPLLYKIGKKEYYDQLPYHQSWPAVLYNFLFDKHVGLFNRIKRKETAGVRKTNIKAPADNADYTGEWLNGTAMNEINGSAKANIKSD